VKDIDHIRAAVSNRLTASEIEAGIIHRTMTDAERTAYHEARAIWKLKEAKRKAEKKARGPMSVAERVEAFRERQNAVVIPPCADPDRRAACRYDLAIFLKTYCTGVSGQILQDPPPQKMLPILRQMQTAITSGVPTHIRMPRGHGKSCYVKCATIYALVYGFRKFVVAVSAKKDDAASLIDDIWSLCEQSEPFAEDFPEFAVPIRALNGKTQRAKSLTVGGERCNIRKNASRIRFPTVKGYPGSGAILDAIGITGKARGKVVGSQRPDLVIFDDLQDDVIAKKESRVRELEKLIDKSFMGMAGHSKRIAAFMTSTPIEPDDLSDVYAVKKTWKTFTFPMVQRFPTCYGASTGDLWAEYEEIYYHEVNEGNMPEVALCDFYSKHREEMDAGAEVLNPGNFDRDTELSGVQHAMNLVISLGREAFDAEYQMMPHRNESVFRITAKLITSRVRVGVDAGEVPDDSVLTVAATDLNPSYGFTSAICCFNRDMTGHVTAYHVMKTDIHDSGNKRENATRVYDALVRCAREIAEVCKTYRIEIDAWGIDAGGTYFDTVHKFARNAADLGIPFRIVPMTGRAGMNWNPRVGTRVKEAQNDTVECGDRDQDGNRRRWVFFNANVWKENAQAAWKPEIGSPGGLSLFDGGAVHDGPRGIATQIANEYLVSKSLKCGKWEYKWKTREPHDFGDVMAMIYAISAYLGFNSTGDFKKREKKKAKAVFL